MAQLETTVKTQGTQLISADIKNKSLTVQVTMETSSKETLQQSLATKDSQLESLEEKVQSCSALFIIGCS